MIVTRQIGQSMARLVKSPTVSVQTKRTVYPHYVRYMARNIPGAHQPSFLNKVIVYWGFVIGIMGPPTFIMYDVGKKRPRTLGAPNQ